MFGAFRLGRIWILALSVCPWISAAQAGSVEGITESPPPSGPSVKVEQGYMVPYTAQIPGTEVTFAMVPIPGGTFTIGSPDDEAGRNAQEGPQRTIVIPPFWMAQFEVTWQEYRVYMHLYDIFKDFETRQMRLVTDNNRIDAITAPTPLYEPEFTFELGDKERQPAVTMSHYAAKQYTKWLSAITRNVYRLPSEAEWEYACRAGSTNRFSFGDDAAQLDEYAWHTGNSDETYHEVGQKKPNAWGLHDMHGNVAELCLDQYQPDAYQLLSKDPTPLSAAIRTGDQPFPHVIRGGSWDDHADELRCARRSMTEDWREEDPNLPKSPWWFTGSPARRVGMRIVRQLNSPTEQERTLFWEPMAETIKDAVENRILNGRGVFGLVDPSLTEAIDELNKKK